MEDSANALRPPLPTVERATYATRNEQYWHRNLIVCVFGSFTTLVSLSMLLPFLPLYVQQLGVTSTSAVVQWSGVAFGVTFLGTALTAPLWGQLADRFGRKPMLIRAAVGMAVVMSTIGLAHNVYELVALRFAAGAGGRLCIGIDRDDRHSGAAGAFRLGAGVLSTGVLRQSGRSADWRPVTQPDRHSRCVLCGGRNDCGRCDPDGHPGPRGLQQAAETRSRDNQDRRAAKRQNHATLAALLVTAMMVLLANMSIEPIITVYIGQLGVVHNRLATVAGIVMACSAFGSMLMAARLGALADRIGGWNVIIGCLVATGIVMIPQAFVTEWWQLAVLRGLMGMTLAGLLPSIAKLVRQSVQESNSGKMLGYLQSSQYAGQVIGPLLGGAIGVHFGMRWVFFVTGAVLIGCAILDRWARERQVAGDLV